MPFFPTHTHDHWSLLDGLQKPEDIASTCIKRGFAGSAITNHGTISSAVALQAAFLNFCSCAHSKENHLAGKGICNKKGCSCQEYKNYKLKSILGNEFYLSAKSALIKEPSNRHCNHLVVLAKNLAGWKSLIQATSESNRKENFYYKNRLSLEELAPYAKNGNFISFSGHIGSDLAAACFKDPNIGYNAKTFEEARASLLDRAELRKSVLGCASKYRDIFGKDNFFLEIQLIDQDNSPASRVVSQILRKASVELGIPCVATADSHYSEPEDAIDQRVLLCSSLKTTMKKAESSLGTADEIGLASFFKSNRYHIPFLQEMEAIHTEAELRNSVLISEACEEYSILSNPMIPTFPCPNGLTQTEYFRKLCEEGFVKRLTPRTTNGVIAHPEPNHAGKGIGEYRERLEKEFSTFTKVGLDGYFLIVEDYCRYARSQGWLLGEGRGSAAGSLISYVLGITDVDPLPYDLLVERFYNDGRNSPGKVSLPDIDTDVQTSKREKLITYIKNKYGFDRVCQISNYGRLQGKSALKEVLRVHDVCSFEQMNEITKGLPSEAEISDLLQSDFEEYGESSIIRHALENDPKDFEQWCKIDDEGELVGDYARYFAQAIRLEGTLKSRGKHASGLIICDKPLSDICPMVYDKGTDEQIIAYEMKASEKSGLAKFDVLAQSSLDKLQNWCSFRRTGELDDEN